MSDCNVNRLLRYLGTLQVGRARRPRQREHELHAPGQWKHGAGGDRPRRAPHVPARAGPPEDLLRPRHHGRASSIPEDTAAARNGLLVQADATGIDS
jgi:hypothetical protein